MTEKISVTSGQGMKEVLWHIVCHEKNAVDFIVFFGFLAEEVSARTQALVSKMKIALDFVDFRRKFVGGFRPNFMARFHHGTTQVVRKAMQSND